MGIIMCMYNNLESDVNNIGHIFYIISLWILIITIYIGIVLHFMYVVFITIHVSTVLHFTHYNLRQFYYILRQLLHFTSKCYSILRQYYISRNYCNLRQYNDSCHYIELDVSIIWAVIKWFEWLSVWDIIGSSIVFKVWLLVYAIHS